MCYVFIRFFNFLLLFIFCYYPWAFVVEESEQIIVRLETEHPRIPIYLTKMTSDASLSESYTRQLEEVLRFDLNHNGATRIVPRTGEGDALALKYSFELIDKADEWRSLNVMYVVKARIFERKFTVRIFSVNGENVKGTDEFLLDGSISQDRKKIHQIADLIHKVLFGVEGIASHRFLYTIKEKMIAGKENKCFSEVWEADYDGANARQITKDGSFCVSPTYIPAKHGFRSGNFCYVSYQTGQPKIYIAGLKDGKGTRLSILRGNQLMPIVSLQRDKIAFICDVTGNPDLFVQAFSSDIGAIDKPQQIFSAPLSTQASPTFSPDGKRIAFVSNKDGSPRIYVMDIPVGPIRLMDVKATLLTKHTRESSAPVWSPDGTKLAYCAMTQGVRQIWVYDFTTGEERQVTQGIRNKENPAWAANSLHLIFNSVELNSSDLYLINLYQPEAIKITSGPGEKRFPNWEPRQ